MAAEGSHGAWIERWQQRKLNPQVANQEGFKQVGEQGPVSRTALHSPHVRVGRARREATAGGTFHRRLQPLYTEKTHGFVLRLPPQNQPHATFMQPLQCVLQHHAHIHAAITLRFASTRCKTQWRNRLTSKRSKPPAAHRRYPSSPAAATLHGKTQGFVLRLPNTSPMQHSCSHHNAFCSMTWLTRMYLRTWQHQITTIMPITQVYCYVMSSLTPQPHTTLHWVYWYVMSSLTPPFIECVLMWCQVPRHPSLSALLQVKVIRNSEDCFPTSFDELISTYFHLFLHILAVFWWLSKAYYW